MYKITYEQVAVFLNIGMISCIVYYGKMFYNHSQNIGFEFHWTDALFISYGFFFSQILFVLGQKFTQRIRNRIISKTFPGQSFEEKLLQIGSSLGEALYQLINVIFMGYFLGGTEYCPSSLGGTLDLNDSTIDKHDTNVSLGVQFIYMASFGFSLTKLYVHFHEQSPKEYKTYFTFLFHHILTSSLILSSYMLGIVKWGIAIWFLHEVNEFVLKSNRIIRQVKGLVNFSNYYFLMFAILWLYLRVYGYAIDILQPVYYGAFQYEYKDIKITWMSRVFFVALFCLFTLNIKWGLEICFATYKKLVHKKDTRKSILTAVFCTAQVIILPILTHTWFYFLNNLQNSKIQVQQEECLINSHDQKKQDYKHLIQKIENDNFEDSSNNKLSLTSNANQQQIIEEESQSKIKWVLIEDYLFDVTGFMHPLGRFLLKQMRRQDITREYYGLKSCLFYNRKTKAKKFIKHCHVSKTNNFLEKRCIAKINMNNFIKKSDHQERSDTVASFQFEKFDQNIDEQVQQYIWKIDLYYPEQENQQTKIFQLKDTTDNFIIDLKSFWPYYFGKYFLITTQQQNTDWMYFSFSLSSIYIKKKIEWINNIKSNLEEDIQQYLEKSVQNLNLFFELDRSQETISNCKHLCLIGKDENFNKLKNQKLQISKPLGGLCIEGFSCRNYLIIAKDQSIYPLIDLIEFLACKTLMESSDMDIQHFIFNKDYLAYFYNQPKIYIYLEISKEFEKEAEFLLLNNLQLINKQYQSDSDKKISQVLRKVVICMNDLESDSILVSKRKKKAKNFKEILKILKISKSKKPDMVMLGGDEKFQSRTINGFNLQLNKLHFL